MWRPIHKDIDDVIRGAASSYDIPEELLRRLVQQESGGSARARSPKGAMGAAQLMPGTAKELGVTDPYDLEQSIYGGAKYLREQYERFRERAETDTDAWSLALAAYNAGPNVVARYGGIPPYKETKQFVQNIIGGGGWQPLPPAEETQTQAGQQPAAAAPPVVMPFEQKMAAMRERAKDFWRTIAPKEGEDHSALTNVETVEPEAARWFLSKIRQGLDVATQAAGKVLGAIPPGAAAVHGQEPWTPEQEQAAERLGTGIARGVVTGATMGAYQPGAAPTDEEAWGRTIGEYAGMAAPITGISQAVRGGIKQVAPELLKHWYGRTLASGATGAIFGAGREAVSDIAKGELSKKTLLEMAERGGTDALAFMAFHLGLEGAFAAIGLGKKFKDMLVKGARDYWKGVGRKLTLEEAEAELVELYKSGRSDEIAKIVKGNKLYRDAWIRYNQKAAEQASRAYRTGPTPETAARQPIVVREPAMEAPEVTVPPPVVERPPDVVSGEMPVAPPAGSVYRTTPTPATAMREPLRIVEPAIQEVSPTAKAPETASEPPKEVVTEQPTSQPKEVSVASPEPPGTTISPEPGETLAEIETPLQKALKKSEPQKAKKAKLTLERALETGNLRLIAKAWGLRFRSDDPIIKNFAPEEQRLIRLMLTGNPQKFPHLSGSDVAYDEMRNALPGWLHYETADEFLRAWLDNAITNKDDIETLWRKHYEEAEELARDAGVSAEEFRDVAEKIEAGIKAEADSGAIGSIEQEFDFGWDEAELEYNQLIERVNQFKRLYPDITDEQARILAEDPELAAQVAKGNWAAIMQQKAAESVSDVGSQRGLPGFGGGLFDEPPDFDSHSPGFISQVAGVPEDQARVIAEDPQLSVAALSDKPEVREAAKESSAPTPPTPDDFAEIAGEETAIKKLYAGFPPGPDLTRLIRKFKSLKNRYFADISEKDMSLLAQYFDLPAWQAAKDRLGGPEYQVQLRREMLRHWANDELLGELDDTIRWRYRIESDNPQMWENFKRAVWHFDAVRVEPTDDQLAKFGLDQEAISHYRKLRELLDYIWDEDLPNLMMEHLEVPRNEIDEMRRERGKISGFFPHLREGAWYVVARGRQPEQPGMVAGTDKPERQTVLHFELFDDALATVTGGKLSAKAKKKIKQLKAMYPGAVIKAGKHRRISEDVFWRVSTQNLQAVIEAALKRAEMPEGVEEDDLRRALVRAVVETLHQRGFGSHFLPRKDIPGFDKSDPIKSVIRFIQSYNGFKTKVLAAKEFSQALSQRDPRTREYAYWSKYVRDMLQNATTFDRLVDKIKSGFYLYFLGFVPRQLILQPTQNFIAGVPYLQEYTKRPALKITGVMLRAAADKAKSLLTGKQHEYLSEEIRTGLEMARRKGILEPQLMREYEGYMEGLLGKAGKAVSRAAGIFIGAAEQFNRETAYIAAYRIAKNDLKMSHLGAMKFAEDAVERIHFRYGKANLPPITRGGELESLLRGAYQFRSFNANLLRLYAHIASGGRGGRQYQHRLKAIAKGIGALLALGGITSFFGYKTFEKLIHKSFGFNIRSEVAKKLGDWAVYVNYGLPALIGIDLSGSMGMEAPKDLPEVLGVPAELVRIPWRVGQDIARGDYLRALESGAPAFLKGPIAAYRIQREGMSTRKGRPITDEMGRPIKFDLREAVTKALSLKPVKESDVSRKYEAAQNERDRWYEWREELISGYGAMAIRYGVDSPETRAKLEEIKQYNKALAASDLPTRVKKSWAITAKTLRSHLRPGKTGLALKHYVQ